MKVFGIALLAQCAFGFILPRQEAETKAFTDPATGIVFQTYTSKKNSKFGIALPKTGTKDLIGYLSAPKGFTYGGGVLGSKMNGTVLLVAWPNGNEMIGSIRKVPDGPRSHAAPPVFDAPDISLKVIKKGTFVAPSGDWQMTFLCTGCLDRKDVYPANKPKETLAWALSNDKMAEPANPAGKLHHHHAGDGMFMADMEGARNEKYEEWVKLAA